jgi:cation diffusion facilitator family transporter
MHTEILDQLKHDHHYVVDAQHAAERRTRWVIAVTLIMMAIELVTGYITGSLALTADGWHMGSHAAALCIAAFAYAFSRRYAGNRRFTFGTGKMGPLAGYTSAVVLAVIAALMALQSVARLLHPVEVQYADALGVAVVGLIVNLVCAFLLSNHDHDHSQEQGHGHCDHREAPRGHAHAHRDLNLRAAYVHVVADALTSVLAIAALLCGMWFGWEAMDPLMGIVGAVLIARWSAGLLMETGQVLLDAEDNRAVTTRIVGLIERAGDRIADLHLWRVGNSSHACIVSLWTHDPKPTSYYKALLAQVPGIDHVTVEVNCCGGSDPTRLT